MKKKSFLMPTIYLLLLFSLTIGLYVTKKAYDSYSEDNFDNVNYVSNVIMNRNVPVISIEDLIINPYLNDKVIVKRSFYDHNESDANKEKSLVLYNGTYMPNTGIDYEFNEIFDVVSIYDGTVVDVFDDELLGKTVEIRHNNEIISVYQSLNDVIVSKGDIITQGETIAKSGTNKINNNSGYNLHFEIFKNGEIINPSLCIGKKLGDI